MENTRLKRVFSPLRSRFRRSCWVPPSSPAKGGRTTARGQTPSFVFLGTTDVVLLGLGVPFLPFGFPLLRKVSPAPRLKAWGTYLPIGYLMVSWWPHLGMHASIGLDPQGLLYTDYTFHLPLGIAGVVLAYCVFPVFRGWMRGEHTPDARGPFSEERLAGNPIR